MTSGLSCFGPSLDCGFPSQGSNLANPSTDFNIHIVFYSGDRFQSTSEYSIYVYIAGVYTKNIYIGAEWVRKVDCAAIHVYRNVYIYIHTVFGCWP